MLPSSNNFLMQRDQEIINRWKSSAPFWKKHRDVIRGMFAPVTQALIEGAEIGSEDSVLAVATVPGEPALSVAALVGLKGKVFGVDPIQGMVAAVALKCCGRA
jgi:ubiquinone/menaquinone biosynthesis C-methylase UbiE